MRRVLCALKVNGKTFGQLALGEINGPVAREALHQLQNMRYTGTVSKARVLIGECFRLAMADGLQIADPTSALRGRLLGLGCAGAHHVPAATEAKAFAAVLKAIERHLSLQLALAWNCSPSVIRGLASFAQRDGAISTLPLRLGRSRPELRKSTRAHHAAEPASDRDLERLARQSPTRRPSFPGASGRPLSKIALQTALIAVGVKKGEHSCHGFRASASTLLRASRTFDALIIEISLAHLVGSATDPGV